MGPENPEGLIEVLTGKKVTLGGARSSDEAATNEQRQFTKDPRDERIEQLERKIEQREIEQERHQFQTEFDEAVKKYPHLDDEFVQSYLKMST